MTDVERPRPRTALVVEGGGMRGVFAAGVLDAFAEAEVPPFDLAIGTSAGACVLAWHLAGQPGRARGCYTDQMCRREYVSARRYFRGGHWVDLDWLWAHFQDGGPLDVARAAAGPTEFVVAATDADAGAPLFLTPDAGGVLEAVKGSCALPVLYRGPVTLERGPARGRRVADGGVTAPIPAAEAYRRGARRIVVVRTRPSGVVREGGLQYAVARRLLRRGGLGALADALARAPAAYRAAVDWVARPPADCALVEVAPPAPLASGRASRSPAALERDYALGRRCGAAAAARAAAISSTCASAHAASASSG